MSFYFKGWWGEKYSLYWMIEWNSDRQSLTDIDLKFHRGDDPVFCEQNSQGRRRARYISLCQNRALSLPKALQVSGSLLTQRWSGKTSLVSRQGHRRSRHRSSFCGNRQGQVDTHYTHWSASSEREPRHRDSSTCHVRFSPHGCDVQNTNVLTRLELEVLFVDCGRKCALNRSSATTQAPLLSRSFTLFAWFLLLQPSTPPREPSERHGCLSICGAAE